MRPPLARLAARAGAVASRQGIGIFEIPGRHPLTLLLLPLVLIADILVVPFLAVGLGYWVTASEYVTDRTVTLDQPVPFSHEHHAGGLDET